MSDAERRQRHFSSEDKAAAAKRHILSREPVSAICDGWRFRPIFFIAGSRSSLTMSPLPSR